MKDECATVEQRVMNKEEKTLAMVNRHCGTCSSRETKNECDAVSRWGNSRGESGCKNWSHYQPAPIQNESTPVWHLVVADMLARDTVGRRRYGTPLQAGNGRDALQDAYEEALDLAVYLRQAIEERKQQKGSAA